MPRRSLADARVLLTGASSGIGRALSLELARRKARLILVARRVERLEELAREIASFGGEAKVVTGDIVDASIRDAAIQAAAEAYGGLDILINNAGVGAVGSFEHADQDRLRRIMEVNFFAGVELIRAALPQLRSGNRPLIVNVGSILGHRGVPTMSEYCASKFALTGFSESLRTELAGQGIGVLLVSPGRTESDFQENLLTQRPEPKWPGLPRTPAATVVRRIVRAIERGRSRSFPNWSARALDWANRLSPSLVDRILNGRG